MTTLDVYGKIMRAYQGQGTLTLVGEGSCECFVRAVQLADGKVMANCLFTKNLDLVRKCLDKTNEIESIRGTINGNDEFSLEEKVLYTNFNDRMTPDGNTISMIVLASSMTASKQRSRPFKSVRFGLTNFEFIGNKFKEYASGGGGLDILVINLADRTIEIHETQDYRSTVQSVKAQRGIDVTSEAVVEMCSADDLDTATQLVDTLCKLLSFARGTKINWIYYDCYNDCGEKVLSFHKNNVTWQYTGLPVIDPGNPQETANFIQQAYTSYLEQKDIHGLDLAIEAYLDAKRESVYLETRALRAVVILEFLKSRYATRKGIEFIIQKGHFKKVSRKMKRTLEVLSISEMGHF